MNEIDIKLYELFARKELSEGCKVICNDESIKTVIEGSEYGFYIEPNGSSGYGYICYENEDIEMGISSVIGHEPQLHDVFRVANDKAYEVTVSSYWGISIITHEDDERDSIKYNPILSLINQTDETKTQIISLFS